MDSIKVYETKQEYLNDIESLPIPSIQYVKETDESCIKDNRYQDYPQGMRIYVDDFPDNEGVPFCEWGNSDWLNDFTFGIRNVSNDEVYIWSGDTITIDDKEYYLWHLDENMLSSVYGQSYTNPCPYVLTKPATFEELQEQSLIYNWNNSGHIHPYCEDYEVPFTSFYGLYNDFGYLTDNVSQDYGYKLVDVEKI